MVVADLKTRLPNLTTLRELVLSVCFVCYIGLTVIWLLPNSEPKTRIFDHLSVWWNFWGLNQNWSLFSPEIRSINLHVSAVITFEDGTKLIWQAPRMDKLGLLDRFYYEKFRKLVIDSMPWPSYKSFWIDTAKYVGKKFYCPENKPVWFSLQLHWIEIPKPEGNLVDRNALPEHTKIYTVFSYKYGKEDFQR
jgi:hypothetical protein